MPELKLENSIVDERYLVDHCLGRGSYAEIFLAYDQTRSDEALIIKALNMTLQGTPDPELEQTLTENFQNEAIALDKVRHPNIIRRLGHGTAADLTGTPFHYLLLEYMPGGDLLDYCRRHLFSLDDALFYFQQVAEALAYAHSQAVIHRDIKPNNLLLSADKKLVKVTDFGVAKMGHDDSLEITRVGTNVYAPPEHHPDASPDEQTEKLTPSADVYSLAKTIYTAMTGRAPRQFSREAIADLPANLAAAAWGAALLAVLKKATAPRVAGRYQSVQEFWEDFARLSELATVEADDEATVVSRRLSGTSTVERAAAPPNFQTMSGALERNRPQKARIVVELPPRRAQPDAPPPGHGDAATAKASGHNGAASSHTRTFGSPPANGVAGEPRMGERVVVANGTPVGTPARVVERLEAREKAAADLLNQRLRESREAGPGFFDNLRAAISSDWLRRVFIILLIVALVGLAASTYYYFAEQKGGLFGALTHKDGQITNPNGALTNLRGEPSLDDNAIIAKLQNGTRVRVIEDRGRWVRVKILLWLGSPPSNPPEDGWVDSRFVKLD